MRRFFQVPDFQPRWVYSCERYGIGLFCCLLWLCFGGRGLASGPWRVEQKIVVQKQTMRCQDTVKFALANNPDFLATQVSVHVALRYLRGLGVFPTNPELEAVGKFKAKPENEKIKTEPSKVEMELTWKFPIGGRWTREQQWAKATLQRVEQEVRAARISLILKSQKACYDFLVAQQKYELYQQLNQFYLRILALVEQRKRSGAATILDYNLARMEWLRNQAELSLANMEIGVQKQRLVALMGWTGNHHPQIQDVIAGPLQAKPSLVSLLQQAKEQHYLIKVAEGQLQEAEKALAFDYAKAIPDLKIKLFYSVEDGFNHTFGAGFVIPIPLLWRNQAKIWSNQAKIRQVRLKLRALQFKIQQRVKQTYLQFQGAKQVFQLYEQQLLPTFRQQLLLREKGLRLGSFTILQVIAAQQSENKALLQRITVLKQLVGAYIALQFAVGGLLTR